MNFEMKFIFCHLWKMVKWKKIYAGKSKRKFERKRDRVLINGQKIGESYRVSTNVKTKTLFVREI
jgi:hypothetical protein